MAGSALSGEILACFTRKTALSFFDRAQMNIVYKHRFPSPNLI